MKRRVDLPGQERNSPLMGDGSKVIHSDGLEGRQAVSSLRVQQKCAAPAPLTCLPFVPKGIDCEDAQGSFFVALTATTCPGANQAKAAGGRGVHEGVLH